MSDTTDFEVDKRDLRRTRYVPGRDTPAAPLAPGQVLVRVDRFALTANNITYGAVGDQLGYWTFFPASEPGWGRVPVWGFADVVASRHDAVPTGERLFGYFPMSTHLVLQADEVSPGGLVDAAAHRAPLPPFYNRYQRVAADPGHQRAHEPAIAIFRPLFATGWLLDDFLAEQGFFGARAVVITSASSKTSLGLAHVLAATRRPQVRVVGLTSARHAAFVARTGYYDQVVSYDDLAALPTDAPAVLVDMAGDRAVRQRVHERFGDQLRFSSAVGRSHWEAPAGPPLPLPGPAPSFFFAPEQARKRLAEWGAQAFGARVAGALRDFLASATPWLRIVEGRGEAAVEATYRAMLEGQADPAQGHVVGL
jgi:hypothetical protein